jgi:amino acid transporter
MNISDDDGTTVLRQVAEYKPPKSFQSWLIGRPLQTADSPHQTIGKLVGLAVFASDALSSSAYSAQEVLLILAAAGSGAFHYSIPITFAIVALLTILTISYEQTIHAYPGGGGAYIVARDNLGDFPALIAAAALLSDYILTVAVSISSGVAQIISAYPNLYNVRVWIAVALVFFIMLINLRGVKESGITFAVPTYYFFLMMIITIVVGFFRYFTGSLGTVQNPPTDLMGGVLQPVTLFLILKAFASGTTALTGVEAISNGITAFKEPRSRNAGFTLIWMSVILACFLIGITILTNLVGAIPSEEETVFSQVARTTFGDRGFMYLAMLSATTVILIMAANTAFADFPRLSALTAADGFIPRQFAYRGSRLVYSRGIVALAVVASGLIVVFQASVTRLIPLYAIGVFLSFTLSQAGMSRRWWKSGHLEGGQEIIERGSTIRFDKNWRFKMIVNGIGSVTTVVVTFVFAITKFSDGAWVVILLLPILISVFYSIHVHYRHLAGHLSLEHYGAPPRMGRHRVLITVSGVHRGTLSALRYARSLSDDITAVHVSIDPQEAEKIQGKWEIWGEGVRMVILESPYRLLIEPMLEYVDELYARLQPNETITIVVPQFVSRNIFSSFLHARTADTLRRVLLTKKQIVITEVPYLVK